MSNEPTEQDSHACLCGCGCQALTFGDICIDCRHGDHSDEDKERAYAESQIEAMLDAENDPPPGDDGYFGPAYTENDPDW